MKTKSVRSKLLFVMVVVAVCAAGVVNMSCQAWIDWFFGVGPDRGSDHSFLDWFFGPGPDRGSADEGHGVGPHGETVYHHAVLDTTYYFPYGWQRAVYWDPTVNEYVPYSTYLHNNRNLYPPYYQGATQEEDPSYIAWLSKNKQPPSASQFLPLYIRWVSINKQPDRLDRLFLEFPITPGNVEAVTGPTGAGATAAGVCFGGFGF